MTLKRQARKRIKQKFEERPDNWRIEAVIHDGNWYDFNKWRRVSKVKKEKLQEWIDQNEDYLIKSDEGSYRVSYDKIIAWYEENDLDLEEQIVPNNYPPKLWYGTTETDMFLSAPRRRVGTVSFLVEDDEILNKCRNILRGTAKIYPDKQGRYKAHGLSAVHIKQLLSKGLTREEFESLEVKTRAVLRQRELSDFPTLWVEEALDFYVNNFAKIQLRSVASTISIYLPDPSDVQSQTVLWVITAMKKFDETASVPFSGYLSNVLRHWPYDLPDEHLGKELADFQRQRKRAIDEAQANGYEGKDVPVDVLASIMDITVEEYMKLNNEHETWLMERNATTLTWEDSANEKGGTLVGDNERVKADREKLSIMSKSVIEAAIDTHDWDSAYKVIESIDNDVIDENLHQSLSKEFTVEFSNHLRSMQDD